MTEEGTPTPTRGVPVELDRTRYLRFSLGTVKEMRKEFGQAALSGGLEGEAVAKLMWYGLRHEDKDLTVEQVEDMVDLEHLSALMDAVALATGQRGRIEMVQDEVAPTPDQEIVVQRAKDSVAADDERPPEPAPPVNPDDDAGEEKGAGPQSATGS